MPRKIIHIDMDCFFAAIEMRDRPALRDRPLAVGGMPERRGVVATCNYPARVFGIHSAMPMSRALRLCPDLVILPVDMERYKAVSSRIQSIFREYTDQVEPLSLDEAFLDVSGHDYFAGSATLLAREIRRRIWEQEGLTASAGIAPNKFLAKVASDWNKPNGQKTITPDAVANFLPGLPVEKIPGVGAVTTARMRRYSLYTCGDVQMVDQAELIRLFGKLGSRLFAFSRGVDHRPVTTRRVRKSLSVEQTFPQDLVTLEQSLVALAPLYRRLHGCGSL